MEQCYHIEYGDEDQEDLSSKDCMCRHNQTTYTVQELIFICYVIDRESKTVGALIDVPFMCWKKKRFMKNNMRTKKYTSRYTQIQ